MKPDMKRLNLYLFISMVVAMTLFIIVIGMPKYEKNIPPPEYIHVIAKWENGNVSDAMRIGAFWFTYAEEGPIRMYFGTPEGWRYPD